MGEGGQAVDGRAAGEDHFAVLRLVDGALPAGGFVGPRGAALPVEQHHVEVVGVDLFAQLVDALVGVAAIEGRHLGHELIGVARNAFERDAEHGVHVVVGVGGLEEAHAIVVRVADEAIEAFLAEVALDLSAEAARAEGEARDLDAGFAEGDEVGGAAGFRREGNVAEGGGGAGSGGGFEEVAAGVARHDGGSSDFASVARKGREEGGGRREQPVEIDLRVGCWPTNGWVSLRNSRRW